MYTFIQKDYPKTRGLLQNKCKRVKQNISFSWKAITGVIENNEISTCSFLENFQKQKQYYFFLQKTFNMHRHLYINATYVYST